MKPFTFRAVDFINESIDEFFTLIKKLREQKEFASEHLMFEYMVKLADIEDDCIFNKKDIPNGLAIEAFLWKKPNEKGLYPNYKVVFFFQSEKHYKSAEYIVDESIIISEPDETARIIKEKLIAKFTGMNNFPKGPSFNETEKKLILLSSELDDFLDAFVSFSYALLDEVTHINSCIKEMQKSKEK
jgi:hypothetical protein